MTIHRIALLIVVAVAIAAPAAADPVATLPAVKKQAKQPKPVPKSKGQPGYMPAIHPDDVKAEKMDTSKVIRKTAGELGLPGLPPRPPSSSARSRDKSPRASTPGGLSPNRSTTPSSGHHSGLSKVSSCSLPSQVRLPHGKSIRMSGR